MSKPKNGSRPEQPKERQARAAESLQNGGQSPAAAMPAQSMAPPAKVGAINGSVEHQEEPTTPLAQELMTLKVKLPTLGTNGELEALKTMRVKVPRQEGVDAGVVGAAVAQSLEQLNQGVALQAQRADSTPDPLLRDDRGGGGDRRRHSREDDDG